MTLPDDGELYDLLNDGLALYAAGKYYEAHEVWEYAWGAEVGRRKLTLQAIIQIAAGLYKHQQGVHAGTCKLLAKAGAKVDEIRTGCSSWLGIDLVALSADVARALSDADEVFAGRAERVRPPPLPAASGPDGILYLHGFASGPTSSKAKMIVGTLRAAGFHVALPDQNEDDFEHLTISRALALAKRNLRDRTIVIGSSLGGYLATLLAAADDRIKALVLMAPAFDFAARMETRSAAEIDRWRREGAVEVEHYGYKEKRRIAFGLLEDARKHAAFPKLRVPAYILHGTRDATVPLSASEQIRAAHPNLVELDVADDEHGLEASAGRALDAARRMIARFELRPDPTPHSLEAAIRKLAARGG